MPSDGVSEVRYRTKQVNMWRSTVHTSQVEFKRQGWNLAGSNLLALAVGLASRHFLYVRPRLTQRDFGIVAAATVIGGLVASLVAYLAYGTAVILQMAAIGCLLGLLVGGGSILWKISHWQPVEKLLIGSRSMDRGLQHDLVDKLVLVCTESGIDPESMDQLLATFDVDERGGPGGQFVETILDFFNMRMKMQE